MFTVSVIVFIVHNVMDDSYLYYRSWTDYIRRPNYKIEIQSVPQGVSQYNVFITDHRIIHYRLRIKLALHILFSALTGNKILTARL